MSFFPQEWRSLAMPNSGKAGSWRGTVCGDTDDQRSWRVPQCWQSMNWRGHVGPVQFRYVGVAVNRTITGVTRDSSGVAVGNCSLDLYMTGADTLSQNGVSDASGNFTFFNPGSGPFYIVAYKVGAPDIAGTTVNTLVGV